MSFEELSREIILDHYQNPRNHGQLGHVTIANRGYNPLCGDEVELWLTVDREDRICEIGFGGRGCSISQASASMMTEAVKGHSLDEAQTSVESFSSRMTSKGPPPADLEEELDALLGVKKYPARVKCAMLPWSTLQETVSLYRKRQAADGPPEDGAEAASFDCSDAP